MEDMDFQVGDAVEHLSKGWKGKVLNMRKDCFEVQFDNGKRGIYYLNGNNSEKDTIPTIYHAGSIKREGNKIIIDPVKPVRERWVNVYLNNDGRPFFGDLCWNKKEADTRRSEGGEFGYITTIQLKRSGK